MPFHFLSTPVEGACVVQGLFLRRQAGAKLIAGPIAANLGGDQSAGGPC